MSFVAANRKPLSRYVPRQRVRQDPPVPPRWVPPPPGFARPPLSQFVILSMLFHALAIALFGAPSGGSREGRAMWGGFNVVLKEYREPPPKLKLAQELALTPRAAPAPAEKRPRVSPSQNKREEGYLTVPLKREIALPPLELPPELPLAPQPPMPAPAPVQRIPAEPAFIPAPLLQPTLPPLAETPIIPAVPSAPVEAAPVVEAPKAEAPKPEAPKPEIAREPPPAAAIERVEPRLPAPAPVPRIEAPLPRVPPKEPESAYDPTAPGVDLDAMRRRAGQIAREGSGQRAVLPFPMPPIPKAKSEVEVALEKARKPDCRTAYSALGLAAIVPLIANEFGEGGCRW